MRYTIISQKKSADLSRCRGKGPCKSRSSSQTFEALTKPPPTVSESIGGWASEPAAGTELFLLFTLPAPVYLEWFLGLCLYETHKIKINTVQCRMRLSCSLWCGQCPWEGEGQ